MKRRRCVDVSFAVRVRGRSHYSWAGALYRIVGERARRKLWPHRAGAVRWMARSGFADCVLVRVKHIARAA